MLAPASRDTTGIQPQEPATSTQVHLQTSLLVQATTATLFKPLTVVLLQTDRVVSAMLAPTGTPVF